jgi:hypothetical protein
MTDKLIYDLVQRIEVINGVPKVVSTNIHIVEGGTDLFSIAESWLAQNTNLQRFNKQQYVGYKKKGEKRYQLVLTPRSNFLQVSFLQESLSGYLVFTTEPDSLFPYAVRVAVESKEALLKLLEDIFPEGARK